MPTILADSCSNLTMIDQPKCGNDYGSPYMLAMMHHTGSITKSGTVPTVSEMETAIALGSTDSASQMIVVRVSKNTTREEGSAEEVSAENTLLGISYKYNQTMTIAGNFVEFDEDLKRKLELLGQNEKVRLWIITDKNYLFGEDGYICSCDVDKSTLTTTGSVIPFRFQYITNRNETDYASQDTTGGTAGEGYKGLTNYSAS